MDDFRSLAVRPCRTASPKKLITSSTCAPPSPELQALFPSFGFTQSYGSNRRNGESNARNTEIVWLVQIALEQVGDNNPCIVA